MSSGGLLRQKEARQLGEEILERGEEGKIFFATFLLLDFLFCFLFCFDLFWMVLFALSLPFLFRL